MRAVAASSNLNRVNNINIGLMLVSLALAFYVPFETFLFSYAVLGPLHYLTEISWLHDRNYFTQKSCDWLPLVVVTVLLTTLYLVATSGPEHSYLGPWAVDMMLFAFGLALLLAATSDKVLRIAGSLVWGIVCLLLHNVQAVTVTVGLYAATLIHVFIFTGAFVLFGSLKSRSLSGYLSLAVFMACGLATVVADPGALGYVASDYAREAYESFGTLHIMTMRDLGVASQVAATSEAGTQWYPLSSYGDLFTSEASLRIGRLIGFAYTYHYLNWFSKTSVIKWHEVPRLRLGVIVVVWIASLGLYAYDYSVGLRWLLLLSFAHVLLEFPLNHKTFLGIGSELAARVRRA